VIRKRAMEAAAADLHAGLYSRFAAYLRPFTAHFPPSNSTPTRLLSLGYLTICHFYK
jgi:hypothetical protein